MTTARETPPNKHWIQSLRRFLRIYALWFCRIAILPAAAFAVIWVVVFSPRFVQVLDAYNGSDILRIVGCGAVISAVCGAIASHAGEALGLRQWERRIAGAIAIMGAVLFSALVLVWFAASHP